MRYLLFILVFVAVGCTENHVHTITISSVENDSEAESTWNADLMEAFNEAVLAEKVEYKPDFILMDVKDVKAQCAMVYGGLHCNYKEEEV